MSDADLPRGYRWATAEEAEAQNIPDAVLVRRTADSKGASLTCDVSGVAVPLPGATPIDKWLAAYHALDDQHELVCALKEAAGMGEGSYEYADSAGFDLNERYTELAHSAATMLGELQKNSNLPEGPSWSHQDGSVCTSLEISQELPGIGICGHDRRVELRYADGRRAR